MVQNGRQSELKLPLLVADLSNRAEMSAQETVCQNLCPLLKMAEMRAVGEILLVIPGKRFLPIITFQ